MLCDVCSSFGQLRAMVLPMKSRRVSADAAPFSCDCCGRALGSGSSELVGKTLAQLARFGLTGQSLLARRRA